MRKRCWLAVSVAVVLASMLARPADAQAAEPPDANSNPPVASCNLTPDTRPDPGGGNKRLATPIDAALLTSGQPCQEVTSPQGLAIGDELDNYQRGFDFYSWLTFIALNSPADGAIIGKGSRPGGDAMTRWEALDRYRPLADVMLDKAAKPSWGTRVVPDLCKPFDGPGKIILQLSDASWDQPFRTGPLIDQNGNYVLFDILMNKPMFDYIEQNGLYSKQGQERFEQDVQFPAGVNPDPTKGTAGRMGAVMIKVSWRILDPEKDKTLIGKFHTADALIYFPGPPETKAGPACVAKTLGLVGFHIGHKTKSAPQWIWSSFEQVSNAPDQQQVAERDFHPPYSFYDPACRQCPVNETPPSPWDPPVSLAFPSGEKSQVVRVKILPDQVAEEVADLNRRFRALLLGTVWENYELLATQWPSDFQSDTDCNGAPTPTFLANTTLETSSQGRVPLASSSCIACHGNATMQHVPAKPSDYTFVLERARCENDLCGPPVAAGVPEKAAKCGLAGASVP